jgi:AcrR family transcriptional regulator
MLFVRLCTSERQGRVANGRKILPMPSTAVTRTSLSTEDRILEVTGEEARRVGLERMRMGEIAIRADMSRASLYRHFASKEELIGAWTLREIERLFSELDERADGFGDSLVLAVEWLRDHPVFSAVCETNDAGLMRTTLQSDLAIATGREMVSERTGDDAVTSELIVRVIVSLVQAPTEDLDAVASVLASSRGAD